MIKGVIGEICEANYEKWVVIRRHLHKHPETATKEIDTCRFISEYMEDIGLEVSKIYGTGVVAVLKGKEPGKTIAVRADMDALKVGEENKYAFKSKREGYMHACGHDIHMTSVLAAAEILYELRKEIKGNVKFIFQPSEENGEGAKKLIEMGVLTEPNVDAIVGAHVWPGVKTGTIEIMPGPIMGAPDMFEIVVKGKGGHGSQPHLTIDPIPIASEIVLAIQLLVSRKNNPLKPLVITIGSIHGGSSYNIIPDEVVMKGTVRTLDMDLRRNVPIQLERVIKGITEACGANYELKYEKKNPVTVNDAEMTKLVKEAAIKVIDEKNVILGLNPSMVGEDFAYYAQKVPGCLFKIGVTTDETSAYPLHSPLFNPDEKSIKTAAAVFSQVVLDYLKE